MIKFLRGRIFEKLESCIVLDTGNIGYQINLPLNSPFFTAEISEEVLVYTELIVREDDIYYIFQSDIEIGSFCFYTFTFNTNDIYFHSFNIYEEYQNKGLGKLSMTAILYYLKSLRKTKIHLQLLLENTPAYKIYKELGFIITSEISYYKKIIE